LRRGRDRFETWLVLTAAPFGSSFAAMIERVLLMLGAAGLIVGCGTTTKSGHVGDTFSGGGITVTVERVDRHPQIPSDDLSGLSTPQPGNRLLGARVRVCNKYGFAVGTFDFGLSLDGGGDGLIKFPQMNYPDGFGDVRKGCSTGWLVFELPISKRAARIRFAYDDTGSSSSNTSGRPESHERFSWSL
jgi:hypothetical protein